MQEADSFPTGSDTRGVEREEAAIRWVDPLRQCHGQYKCEQIQSTKHAFQWYIMIHSGNNVENTKPSRSA